MPSRKDKPSNTSPLTDEQLRAVNPFLHGKPQDPEKLLDAFAEIIGVTKDAIDAKRKIVNAAQAQADNGDFRFPDMSTECLQGRLGEICFNEMSDFPVAYAWPALLAAASALIEERAAHARTNLYVSLVGPVHSGKSQALERACKLLGLQEPKLLEIFAGSAEQLMLRMKEVKSASLLLQLDELGHLLEKMNIENSSFSYILNRAFYSDHFEVLMGKKEKAVFNTALSLAGGIVEEKFQKLFDASTTGGLYDRFLFGYLPHDFSYNYKPFEGDAHSFEIRRVCIESEVWQLKSNWLTLHKDWNPRVCEIAIRAATIAAAFDGRTMLTAEDLNPAYELVRYQQMVREVLKPNPGENVGGKVANKIILYLKRYAGKYVSRRKMLMDIRGYDMDPSVADRVLAVLKANGDIETSKIGKQSVLRWVTEEEHRLGVGPEEET